MKLLVVCCLVAAALAAPPVNPENSQIVKFENNNIGTGDYQYTYEETNGNKAAAAGVLQSGGADNTGFVAVKGSFEWVGPDGVVYSGTYVADETGYHPHYTQGPGGVIPAEVIKNLS